MTSGVGGSGGASDRAGGSDRGSNTDRAGGVDRAADSGRTADGERAELSREAEAVPEAAAETVARDIVGDTTDVLERGPSDEVAAAGPEVSRAETPGRTVPATTGGEIIDAQATPPGTAEEIAEGVDGDAPVADPEVVDPELADPAAAEAELVPTTEPNPENLAAATGFIDEIQGLMDESTFTVDQPALRSVVNRVADHAAGIEDPVERDRFVRAVAPDVGIAIERLARSTPSDAYRQLDAVGQGVTQDTARLLVGSAGFGNGGDNLEPYGRPGSPVGDALTEWSRDRTNRFVSGLGEVARVVVPGVDAAAHLAEGNADAAAGSLAIDAAGGALIRGGRVAIGALGAAVTLAPTSAEAAGLSRLTIRMGDDAFEIQARTVLVGGRRQGFDVEVPGRFADGSQGTLRLVDERAKHNALGSQHYENISRLARDLSRGRGPSELHGTRSVAQFTGHYNSIEGQAELARLVMARVTPDQLAAIGQAGGRLDVPLDRVVGLTPGSGNRVVPATTVTVMRNNDGSFHLVPMP